jgi:sigma-B regulation protein RsbU (phosphoserine phosphatase)
LLPDDLPDIEGFELSAVYRPGAAAQRVGGDFYDVFEVTPRSYVILIGDVQGKDLAAARVTGLVRHTARALAFEHADPAAVLSATNAALRRARLDRFCTLVYALVNLGDPAQLVIAGAGHPPPILRSADGETVAVETHGPLLGVIDAPAFGTATRTLAAGDAVVLYTDGLIEARVDGALIGEAGLLDLVRDDPAALEAPMAAAVWRRVLAKAAQPQDDVAIVALRRHGGR